MKIFYSEFKYQETCVQNNYITSVSQNIYTIAGVHLIFHNVE